MEKLLFHYGTKRHSGRYPWGSGENPFQHEEGFLAYVRSLKKEGLSDSEIASSIKVDGKPINTADLRSYITISNERVKANNISTAYKLKQKGYSNVAIAEHLGRSESYVRDLLKSYENQKQTSLTATKNMLKESVSKHKYVDVGAGTELYLDISRTKLKAAIQALESEGYSINYVKVRQLGTGKDTSIMVLSEPGTSWSEVNKNKDKIRLAGVGDYYTEDGGISWSPIEKPRSVDINRVDVAYESPKDGVIELRRGVEDISLANARYAQVRILVNGTHYLKGMAMYSDDLPPGVDIRFNTNKKNTGVKLDAMKKISDEEDNPFGAIIKEDEDLILAQRHYMDKNGNRQLSALNIVNEEGSWGKWSKSISSQVLSKQSPSLAKKQLVLAYDDKEKEFNDIMRLTNPAVRRKLLETFADNCDSAAVDLKAAALPRQASYVILPITDISENEIYAPKYRDGEHVVLIRHPHGGIFEIPELVVNNKNKSARQVMYNATDAVGINPRVAAQLSGADFDGDSVLVIPNNNRAIKTSAPLKSLINFDPKLAYPGYSGMKKMTNELKQKEMGKISNLITDMTIRGASFDEIARAVRHSMVVIDAEKHGLNYKKSFEDNGIAALKEKYQGSYRSGASTLISLASSEEYVDERKEGQLIFDPRTGKSKRVYVDPETGEKLYSKTGAMYNKPIKDSDGNVIGWTEKEYAKKTSSTKMYEAKDARSLSSGTIIENVYAEHANKLKALGNKSRLEADRIQNHTYSPEAHKLYSEEVASLKIKLAQAEKNRPLERQAQILANFIFEGVKKNNPDMDKDAIKKAKGKALIRARKTVGSGKNYISITQKEWDAIQAGAISNNFLNKILDNTDLDLIKQYATPRANLELSQSKVQKIQAMYQNGYTYAQIADSLGVSTNTVAKYTK